MALSTLINQRTIYTIIFFVLVTILCIVWKPKVMFDDDNNIKQFGVGGNGNKTILSLGCFIVILSFVSFYIFAIIDVIFARKIYI